MADISSLNIQISASTGKAVSAIRNLQRELGNLNMSLNNYSEKSEYVRGLQRLATGLTGLGNAVDSIDATKLTSIANAIGDLATKGAKLSGLSVAKAFSQMGVAAQQTSERTKKAAKEIAGAFDIKGKKGLDDLRASIDRFYASAGNDKALKSASDDIEDTINQYRKYKNVVDETYLAIRKWVSSTNVAMPKGATSEFIDEFNKIRGVIGFRNTGKGGIGFDTMLGEMNEKFGTHFDTSNAVNGLRELAEYLRKGSTQQEQYEKSVRASLHTDEVWIGILDRMKSSIEQVKTAQESVMVDKNGFLTGEGVDDDLAAAFNGDLVEKEAQQVQTAGQTITSTINDIKQDMIDLSEYTNPFQGIVDGLEALEGIRIEADQFTGVKVLAESLGRLTGVNSEKAGTNIPLIAQGLETLVGIHIPDNAAQLEAYGNAIAKFGTKAATRAQGLPQVAEGLRQIASIGEFPDVSGIYELAKALSKLGGAKVEVAIENMPRLANAFIELMSALSKAPNVSDKTVKLAQAMAQLATASKSAGQSVKQSSSGVSIWNNALRSALPTFNKATRHTFSLASAFGKLYASYFLVIRGIRKLGEAIEYSSQLTEVQNVVAHTFGEQAYLMDEFADRSIKDYGMAELAAKQFASRFQAMGTAMDITAKQIGTANDFIAKKLDLTETDYENLGDSMADLSIDLTKLTADYASFFNLDYEDVADDMASIFTGQTRPLRRYGLDLTNATLKEWALKNGIDADIKSMTQAEKTMLRYQYVMANSEHIMGDFARTADTWANVVRTLGQQFQKLGQIIGGGLINLFKPLMMQIRSFMYGAIETVQNAVNAIGKLLGWQISIENVGITMNDEMEEYADNLDDAAGSAKKLNAQLRAIDELNNLTSSNKGGSGSDDSLLGTLGGLDNKGSDAKLNIEYYESAINSWYEFGTKIRDKIIDGLKSIDWDYVSEKVKENAKGFRDTLKGLLFPDREGNTLGGEIGGFLAEVMNLGFDWLGTATAARDVWEAAGHNIADFFTNFFTHFDAESAAEAINNITQGLVTMINTAATDLNSPDNRKQIGDKIKQFLQDIDPETWEILVDVIELSIAATTVKTLGKVAIDSAIKSGLATQIAADLGGMVIGVEIGFAIAPLIYPESGSRENFNKGELVAGIRDFFLDILPSKEKMQEFMLEWMKDKNILGFLGIALKENGVLSDDAWDWLHAPFTRLYDTIVDSAQWVKVDLDEFVWYVKGLFTDFYVFVDDLVSDGWENIRWEFANGYYTVTGTVSDMITSIKNNFVGGLNFIGTSISLWFTNNVQPWFTKDRWMELGENFKKALSDKWNQFSNWFNNTGFKKWWDGVREKFSLNQWNFTGIKDGLVQAFNNAISAIKGVWNTFAEFLNSKLNFEWDDVKIAGKTIIEAGKLELGKIPTFAQGGYPTPGSLFVAGERGAEMLGTVGGKTAVASNGEITGISDTIRQTSSEEIALLRQQNTLLQGILQKEFGISKDKLFKSVKTSASEYTKMTGNPAFA